MIVLSNVFYCRSKEKEITLNPCLSQCKVITFHHIITDEKNDLWVHCGTFNFSLADFFNVFLSICLIKMLY